MSGFNEDFLPVPVPLPTSFSASLSEEILKKDGLRHRLYRDYRYHSVLTNKAKRAPVLAAINIDTSDDQDTSRLNYALDEEDVFIAGALPKPTQGPEWVSLINLKETPVPLDQWTLVDKDKPIENGLTLSGTLQPGQSLVLSGQDLRPVSLNNGGDILTLFDGRGRTIDRVQYTGSRVKPGEAVMFERPRPEFIPKDER